MSGDTWSYDYEQNPYSNPEAVGLEIVGIIECGGGYDFNTFVVCGIIECGGGYDFNTFVVWKRTDDGTLWWAVDSGCSCPMPFEDVAGFDDLNPINKRTFPAFEAALRRHGESYGGYSGIGADKLALTAKVIGLGGAS